MIHCQCSRHCSHLLTSMPDSLFTLVFFIVLQDDSAKQAAKLVFETALLESGFVLEDPKDFANRIYSVIKSNLNVSPDATVEEDEVEEETEKDRAENAVEDAPDFQNFQNMNMDQVRPNLSSNLGNCHYLNAITYHSEYRTLYDNAYVE